MDGLGRCRTGVVRTSQVADAILHSMGGANRLGSASVIDTVERRRLSRLAVAICRARSLAGALALTAVDDHRPNWSW